MAGFDLDKIAPDFSQKILLGFTIFLWVISFTHYSPEQQKTLLDSVGLYNIPPADDWPSIIPILALIWVIIGLVDATYIHLKVMSDVAMAAGMDYCDSCVGAKLHTQGDWGWIRVGGTKDIPIEGSCVWIGLLTHIHRIGTHIVFEGDMIPNTVLDFIPYDLKLNIWQRRGGPFGVKKCSISILSTSETKAKKDFKTEDYKDVMPDEEKGTAPKTMNTAQFILEFFIKNKMVNTGLQLANNENDGLKRSLETIRKAGEAVRSDKEQGFLQHILG